jgi:hypothetical protein
MPVQFFLDRNPGGNQSLKIPDFQISRMLYLLDLTSNKFTSTLVLVTKKLTRAPDLCTKILTAVGQVEQHNTTSIAVRSFSRAAPLRYYHRWPFEDDLFSPG